MHSSDWTKESGRRRASSRLSSERGAPPAQQVSIFPLAAMPFETPFWHPQRMALRCLIVDDSARFLEAARELLEREGVTVVGVSSTSAEALERAQELRPDVALVDIHLGGESGFELARRIAEAPAPFTVILISTRSADDLAELVATSPALGYVSKADLSGHAIRHLLDGSLCEHEALVYSTMEEFLAATVP